MYHKLRIKSINRWFAAFMRFAALRGGGLFIAFANPLGSGGGSLLGIVCSILWWVFYFAIPVALVAIIYAAYLFLTSQGDPGKLRTARSALLAAVLGIIALFLVTLLPRIVSQMLGVPSDQVPDQC